jgi:hypothetical protein
MSVLGKYRKEEDKKDESGSAPETDAKRKGESVPNKERKSPIVSFSIPSDLRMCLKEIRKVKAINLSMWVERTLRDAAAKEFPSIASQFLEE